MDKTKAQSLVYEVDCNKIDVNRSTIERKSEGT